MKTLNKLLSLSASGLLSLSVAVSFSSCKNKQCEVLDVSGKCEIITLRLDTMDGIIDAKAKSVTVWVDKKYDCSHMEVTRLQISEGASCDIAQGDFLNMRSARTVRVTNRDAMQPWKLRVEKIVEKIENPQAVFIGIADDFSSLTIEEQTACQWMLDNIPQSTYASLAQVANGDVDFNSCKIVWWHLHKDGGIDGKTAFESHAALALNAAARLKGYYQKGGSFLLTRYATYLPFYLGEAERFPNNCWGGDEQGAEIVNDPWSFFATGHTDHPLFGGLVMDGENPARIYTCDAGYSITNSTAQWHIGTDWGGYADYDTWRTATGATDIAYGSDGAIVAWEYPATTEHGTILCVGSGCYDWYSKTASSEHYHQNVATMTLNAFNYLMK